MNRRKIKSYCFLFLIIVIVAIVYSAVGVLKEPPLRTCKSQLTLLHDAFTLQATFKFHFFGKQGTVSVNGKGLNQGRDFVIDREITFAYYSAFDGYILTSSRLRRFSNDTAREHGIRTHLPDFFTQQNGELPLEKYYDRYNNPVLFLAGTALFYCQKEKVSKQINTIG